MASVENEKQRQSVHFYSKLEHTPNFQPGWLQSAPCGGPTSGLFQGFAIQPVVLTVAIILHYYVSDFHVTLSKAKSIYP